MKINVLRHFRFDQTWFLADPRRGWCAGLSFALLTHLRQNQKTWLHPDLCHDQAETFLRMVRASAALCRLPDGEGFIALRQSITLIQDHFGHTLGRERRGDPASTHGHAVMMLTCAMHYNARPAGRFLGPSPHQEMPTRQVTSFNHCGLLVWEGTNAFVFDPNFGCCLINWSPEHRSERLPAAVDMALEWMYANMRSLPHLRWSKLMLLVNPAGLPFNLV